MGGGAGRSYFINTLNEIRNYIDIDTMTSTASFRKVDRVDFALFVYSVYPDLSALLDRHSAALPLGNLAALLVRDLATVRLRHVAAVVDGDGLAVLAWGGVLLSAQLRVLLSTAHPCADSRPRCRWPAARCRRSWADTSPRSLKIMQTCK